MHAAFPRFTNEIDQVMKHCFNTRKASVFLDRVGGKLVAKGMAFLLQLVFGLLILKDLPNESQNFFDENFVITDPDSVGGKRYYQGKFLIRTKKPEDDMNVLLKFCPDPDKLFIGISSRELLNPSAVVDTKTLTEERADEIEKNPDKVDLVIRFKDVESIMQILKRPDADMVGLLLDNLVQLTGNVGHLFKIGAIAANVEKSLDLPKL